MSLIDQAVNQGSEKALYQAKATILWGSMNDQDKAVIRFGMFPHATMQAAEQDGFDGRKLAIALMQCAKEDGGMIA